MLTRWCWDRAFGVLHNIVLPLNNGQKDGLSAVVIFLPLVWPFIRDDFNLRRSDSDAWPVSPAYSIQQVAHLRKRGAFSYLAAVVVAGVVVYIIAGDILTTFLRIQLAMSESISNALSRAEFIVILAVWMSALVARDFLVGRAINTVLKNFILVISWIWRLFGLLIMAALVNTVGCICASLHINFLEMTVASVLFGTIGLVALEKPVAIIRIGFFITATITLGYLWDLIMQLALTIEAQRR